MEFKLLKDVKVGDTIYIYSSRRNSLLEKTVEKVGRKYITIEYGTKFTLEGYEVSKYTSTQHAYADKAEYDAKVYKVELQKNVTNFLGSYNFGLQNLSINQLERIVEILKENS